MRAASLVLVLGLFWVTPAVADDAGEEAYDHAYEAHRSRQWDEAAAGFIAAYNAGYREPAAAYNAACALARGRRIDLAMAWLERAFEDGFDLEEYLDEDDDLRSLRADPRFQALRARVLGGKISAKQREGERLAQRLAGLAQSRETRPEKYDGLGRELLNADRYEEAARAFETAAAREEHPATSLYNAACARSLQGQKGPALDLLERAVHQGFADPDHLDEDDDLDNIRGERRFAQIRALAAELEVPGYPSHQRDRDGKTRREWQAAWPRVEAAARRYPHLGQVWFNLGFAHFALDRPEQAIAAFEKAVQLGYRKSTSMYNAACAHALAGNADQAFAWLERAVQAGFDNWWLMREDEDLDAIRTDARFGRYLELARAHGRKSWH
jgi:tetratricopeptide (TPR) repeat protein